MLATCKRAYALYTSREVKAQLHHLGNEASNELKQFMTNGDVDFQLAPPHMQTQSNVPSSRGSTISPPAYASPTSTSLSSYGTGSSHRRRSTSTFSEATASTQAVLTGPNPRCLRLQSCRLDMFLTQRRRLTKCCGRFSIPLQPPRLDIDMFDTEIWDMRKRRYIGSLAFIYCVLS